MDYLWGRLVPVNLTALLTQIYLPKDTPQFSIGRNLESNDFALPGMKICRQHCLLYWDRKQQNSIFSVRDISQNGTYINGKRISRNEICRLRDGNIISFAMASEDHLKGGREDYRYVFREMVDGSTKADLKEDFCVQEVFAEGYRSLVRKAIHKDTGRVYAVKYPRAQAIEGSQDRKFYAHEMEIIDQLHHPNICGRLEAEYTVFNDGIEMMCLILEYVDGGNLLDRISEEEGLSPIQAKDITYQICKAVSYMHSKGILHRDLKVTNILLTTEKYPKVKIAGFVNAGQNDKTELELAAWGTPFYQAPELRSDKDRYIYNEKIDSWNIGVIVFYMLAGCHPFPDLDALARVYDRNCRKVDWSKFSGCVPSTVLNFMRALLKIHPTWRLSVSQALEHDWLRGYAPFNKE